MSRNKLSPKLLLPLCLLAPLTVLDAANITWGSATDVATTTDVLTNGTIVEALNLGYKAGDLNTVTVNGVEFTATVAPAPLTNTTTAAYQQLRYTQGPDVFGTSGDADYDNLLNSIAFGGGPDEVNMTVGGGALVNGNDYEIQVWFVDERSSTGTDARQMQIGDGNGNNVLLGNTTGNKLGQYVIGTFTADGANQTMSLDAQGFGQAHLTAYQIREIVPNPTVTLSTTSDPVTAAYTVDVIFSENVTGLDASDFSVTNGTASDLLPASGPASAYTVLITPTAAGLVTVQLPSATVINGNSDPNPASNSLETTYAPVSAGVITWGSATDVAATTDVSTNGTTVEAVNLGYKAGNLNTVTVNGVEFAAVVAPAPLSQTTTAPYQQLRYTQGPDVFGTSGDVDYDNLLNSIAFGGGGDEVNMTVGGGNLANGTDYEIQVWFVDERSSTGTDTRQMQIGDGNGNTVLLGNTTGNKLGQYVIGTFAASGTNQTITLDAQDFGNAHLTAYQIRALGPPPAPDVPTNLTATAGDGEIILDWDDNAQFGFANFIVQRSTNMGGPYIDIPGATPTASTYTDTGLTNGTPYFYIVAAKNTDDIVSSNSNEATATPEVFVPDPPTMPTGLTITAGNNFNTLNWDDNTQPGFLEFRIKRSESMGGPYTQIGATANSIFTDTTAVNGTTYYYIVTAVNIGLVESTPSDEGEGEPSPSAIPPNFLFIIADDMDTYSVNAYRESEPAELTTGGEAYVIDTPNIDRLATEGMLFHQARIMGSESPAVCQPSRTMIMTGKTHWQRTSGVNAARTLPGIFNRGVRTGLADLPYATYRTCKFGNSYETANAEFTIRDDARKVGNTDGNGSEWHGDRTLEHFEHWRANHQGNGKPFLIYMGFSHPHDERNVRTTPNLTGRYNCVNTISPGSLSLDLNAPPLPLNHLPLNEATGIPANFPFHPFDNGHLDVRDEVTAPGILQYRNEAVVRNEIGRNFGCVDWIDQQIGRVFDKLEDPDGDGDTSDSILQNTYIVFTSDHGIAIGRHGLQGKQNLYEHSWKIPYIVRGPGIPAGSESDALIYLHDTFPTLCDLAGLDVPATIDGDDGQSFRTVLEGGSSTHRDVHYGLYAGGDKPGMRAVTDGRFKLIKYDVDNNAVQETQLFDLHENPFELLDEHGVPNLAHHPAYAGIRQGLEELLMEQRIENADPYPFLGDRTLLRFEGGPAGQAAATLADRLPFGNDGTAHSGNAGALPAFSADVPNTMDLLFDEANELSLDFEQDDQNYVQIDDASSLDFGNAPFTIEAWVKLETMPSGNNIASAMPVVQKKSIGAGDGSLDYLFLAAAGNYGDAATYDKLALHLGSAVIISSLSIPDTSWHFISVAFDPVTDTVRFTLDGQSDTQSTSATGTSNGGPLVIGAHFDGSGNVDSSFDGRIDELSITDGFLTESELQPLQAVVLAAPFHITEFPLAPSGDSINLTFESDETRLYHVQRSTSLAPGSWSNVRTFIPGAAGQTETTVTEIPIDPGAPREFLRVATSTGL